MTTREGPIVTWSDSYLVRKLRASQAQVKGGYCEPALDKRLRVLVAQMRGEMRKRGVKLSQYPAFELSLGSPFWPIKSEQQARPAVGVKPADQMDDLTALLEASLKGERA